MKKKPASARKPRAKAKPARGRAAKSGTQGTLIRAADQWTLRLYIAGQTPRSLSAFANLKRLCEEHLAGRYRIVEARLGESRIKLLADDGVPIPAGNGFARFNPAQTRLYADDRLVE